MDFRVSGHGTIYMVTPVSDAAKEWVRDSVEVESWAWMGESFAVDHRMYGGLVDGIVDAGFSVTEV